MALGAWVAVPECARGEGKGGRGGLKRRGLVAVAAAACVLAGAPAAAQTYTNLLVGQGGAGADGINAGGAGGIGGGSGGDLSASTSGYGGGPGGGAPNAGGASGSDALQPDAGSPNASPLNLSAGVLTVSNILAIGGGGGGTGAGAGVSGGAGTQGAMTVSSGATVTTQTLVIGGGGGGSGGVSAGQGGNGGAGTLNISGPASSVTVSGTLHLGGDAGGNGGLFAALGGAGGAGTLNFSSGVLSAGAFVLGGASNGGRDGHAGNVGGTGTLNLSGTASLGIGSGILSVLNTGVLDIGHDGTQPGVSAAGVTFGFGQVQLAGAINFLQNDGVTFAPAISGAGSLTQAGTGTTTLTGANSYSGGSTVNAGTLALAGAGTAGSGRVTIANAAGAAFDISATTKGASIGSLAGGGSVVLGGKALTTGSDNSSTTYAGAILGTGSFIKVGSGTLSLSGASTYAGGTTVSGGTLVAAASGALGSGTAGVGANASLVVDSGTTQTNLVQLQGNNASFTNYGTLDTRAQAGSNAVGELRSAMVPRGYTGLKVDNAGTIVGNADDASVMIYGAGGSVTNRAGATISTTSANGQAVALYNGGTLVNDGTLIGHSTGASLFGDASVTNSGRISADGVLSAGVSVNYGSNATLVNQAGGVITGAFSGVKLWGGVLASLENAGTVRATSTQADAAAVRVAGGTANVATNLAGGLIEAPSGIGVQMENGTVLNAHGATITAPTAIAITDYTQSATVTNHGTLNGNVYMGSGNATLNLGADGSFNGKADAGIRTGTPGAVKTVALIGSESGAAAANTLDGAQLTGFDTLDVNAANAAWTLTGTFTHAGGTTLRAGRLNVASNNALGTGALSMDDGTTLGFAADGLTVANSIHFTGIADPTIDTGAFTGTLSGAISGAGDLTKTGSGTLVLSGANVYTGATTVAQGTLRAGAANTFSAASAHSVATGAAIDLAGFSQTVAGLDNGGTVSLQGAAPGTTLTVSGAYTGNGGVLRLGTALGDSSSVSDRLVLNGPAASASGKTTVQITNLGGLGGLTSGSGIEVISALNGATTTAQTTKDAFALANGHVDAGAYEYRLQAADASGAGENWYLRSTTDVVPPTAPAAPGEPAAPALQLPTYRSEVPLYAALPEQLRQANLSMLGNLHLRNGDDGVKPDDASSASSTGAQRSAWGRVISADFSIRQQGTVSPASNGRLTGFQAGTDLFANGAWRAGVYVGQLDGDMSVNGFARGVYNLAVGSNDLRNQYLGGYATWIGEGDVYANAVLQAGRHRYSVNPLGGFGTSGTGDSLLASIEVGKAFAVAPGWKIEPQLQLVHQHLSLDDVNIVGARVQQNTDNGWLVRAGVRVKGEIATGVGTLQPYARINVYRASGGADLAQFIGPAATTGITTRTGQTSTELAGGFTLALGERTSVYGELGKLWDSGGESRVKSSVQGSLGMRVKW